MRRLRSALRRDGTAGASVARDAAGEAIRRRRDAVRAVRHARRRRRRRPPRRRAPCRGVPRRSTPPCGARRPCGRARRVVSSFGWSRTCAVSQRRYRASAGVQPGLRRAQRPDPARGEPERAPERRHVPGGRVLARPRTPAPRRRGRGMRAGERAGLVAAVHQRVREADRAHQVVDAIRARARRAGEPDEERVRRRVVGRDDHLAEQRVDARAGRRDPGVLGEHRRGDRELDRRRRGEARLRVPRGAGSAREALDVVAGRTRSSRGRAGSACARSVASRRDATTRGRDPAGRPKTSWTCADDRCPVARDRRDANGHVAARKRHPEREAATLERPRREALPVRDGRSPAPSRARRAR